jgi:hypothetical protein
MKKICWRFDARRLQFILFMYLFSCGAGYCFADTVESTSSFIIGPGETMTIPSDEVLSQGMIALDFDGDYVPGSLLLQVYRRGTTNGAWAITTPLSWGIGATSDPGTGSFRLWIEGNNAGDRLVIRNTTTFARQFRIYNFSATGDDTDSSQLLAPETAADILENIESTGGAVYLPVDYTIAANQTIYVDNAAILSAGPIIISASGSKAPGSAVLQVFRNGSPYNMVSSLAQTGSWGVGTTSEPSSGGFRAWIESGATNARLAIKNTYSSSFQLRIYSIRPYLVVSGDDFFIPDQGALYLPGNSVPMAGLSFISVDGDKSPASAIVQVYRYGTYNGVWSLGQDGSWTMGKTSQPSTGSYRMWVDGNGESARLILRNYASWGRNLRVYKLFP